MFIVEELEIQINQEKFFFLTPNHAIPQDNHINI